jgi:hypothetical protein
LEASLSWALISAKGKLIFSLNSKP